MEEDFYPAYYRLEGRHWWFLGRRRLFLRVLEQQFPPATGRSTCSTSAAEPAPSSSTSSGSAR